MSKTVQILVSGKVQGVCYRASAQKKAKQFGIQGWVKNLPDGQVMIVAHAEPDQLDQFITWCHSGPMFAKVANVLVEEISVNELNAGFIIC